MRQFKRARRGGRNIPGANRDCFGIHWTDAMVASNLAQMMASMPHAVRAPGAETANSSRYRERLLLAAVVVGAAALAALFFSPRYWLWCFAGAPLRDVISIQPEFNRAFFALQQLHEPWQRVENLTHRVIEWRLLFPLLGHYLGFSDGLYLALPHVGCLCALATVASWTFRTTRTVPATAAAILLAGTSSWYFVSTGWLAYFDSWLIAALVIASFAGARWILMTTAALAPWVDERFILALPICLAVRAMVATNPEDGFRALWRDARWLGLGIAPYLLIRGLAELTQARATAEAYWGDRTFFTAPLDATLLGLWHGLRLGWVAVALLLVSAVRRRQWLALAGFGLGLLVNLAVADDLSRSASVAIPALVAGVAVCARSQNLGGHRTLLALGAGNFILPAAHIIATPRSPIERYHTAPIFYLYAERNHAANPPEFASPDAYTRRGIEALQAGHLEAARGQFEMALRYDPEFPRARAHRGILMFVAGQKSTGLAELDHALAAAPDLFDVRLQRATFRQQGGDLRGAHADVSEALRTMPANWPKRREAEAFEKQLAAQLARDR